MRPEVTRRSALKSALSAGVGGVAGALGLPLLGHRPSGNIIFIVCVALRADRIVYRRRAPGGARFIMPTLGRLAREGVSMEMAVAPSSWTPISMGAILFNTNPLNVSYGRGDFEVRNAQPGIAERLSAEGFYTACITANYLLDSPVIRRGFDDFTAMQRSDAEPGGRPLETSSLGVNRAAFSLLPRMRRSRRFFLYLHYMETHEPYFCPDPVLREIGASFSPPAFTSRVRTAYMRKDTHLSRKIPMEEGIRQLITHYDAAALFLDTAIRRLLGKLEVEGLLDDSVVIVTSDHGEEFADNTETQPTFGHNQNLSQMQIHSPLIFWPRHACAAHRCMRAAPFHRPRQSTAPWTRSCMESGRCRAAGPSSAT